MKDLLSRKELKELTGYARPSKQIAWLEARGWAYEVGGDGYPRVLRSYRDQRLGVGQHGRSPASPELSHLRVVK